MTHFIARSLGAALTLAVSSIAGAQRDSTVVVGAHYGASAVYRLLFGGDYRYLWTTPVPARVLDLRTFGGGLTPTTAGGGWQTKSIWFRGADGVDYGFRSVDKEPPVPAELEGTFLQQLARDQTKAEHPGAPPVVSGLLTAAGILHTEPELVVIRDDPLLAKCADFAGVVGYLERRAVARPGAPSFAGAAEIVSTRSLVPRVFGSPAHQFDARAFLVARLTDVLLGDWDRHRRQWTWARFSTASPVMWQPIPEDRDQAFVRFDGPVMSVVRKFVMPQFVEFGEEWPYMAGQTWNGRDIDRWILNRLDRAVWDSVTTALQQRLSDSAINASVRRMPGVWYAQDGERLARTLRWRRDHLPEAADKYYKLLAREASLHATESAELVTIDRLTDGQVRVNVALRDAAGAQPFITRVFDPKDTREVRLYLYAGSDRVVVRGEGAADIEVRIIGGGATEVVDSSRAGGVRLYAAGADSVLTGDVDVDRRAYDPQTPRLEDGAAPRFCDGSTPPAATPRPQPKAGSPAQLVDEDVPARDWGSRTVPAVWVASQPDVGVFIGGGQTSTRYGFRKLPYASSWRWRAGYATTAQTGRFAIDGSVYRTNSGVHATFSALASGIEVLRFSGIGNETLNEKPNAYYRVNQLRYDARAALVLPVGSSAHLTFGPFVTFNDTRVQEGRIIADSVPYGTANFGHAGLQAEFLFDTRDLAHEPTRGFTASLGGSSVPGMWDVATAFGETHGEASAYLTAHVPLRTTLALRAGGKKVFGTYPFSEAAFIGDAATARLGRQNRFGGDAAAWTNAELRIRLGRVFLFVPSDIGVFGLADAGRVFVKGEESDTWHTAAGGGVWVTLGRPGNVVALSVARGKERTALYLSAGFAY